MQKALQKMVLVFVRFPVPGRVKTRMVGRIDAAAACRLYRCFVEDLLQTLSGSGLGVTVCYEPRELHADMTAWLGNSFAYLPQRGNSLGDRMQHAFCRAFAGETDQAVLIGSDLPDLPAGILHEAFAGLTDHDVVLGPAADGGYYLIGFRANSFCPALFGGIPWGTHQVLEKSLAVARKEHLAVHQLPQWQDIDTPEDLKRFYERTRQGGMRSLKTRKFLEDHPDIVAFLCQERRIRHE